jgi:hypothetical protein
MKFSSLMASVFLSGLMFSGRTLQAAEFKTSAPNSVNICLTGDAEHFVVTQAEDIAARMFSDIGIHLEWYHDDRHCKNPPENFLVVMLSSGAPENKAPGALAFSLLHTNPHIQVFYNRILKTVEPLAVHKLLAHVLAHEIAHMLEGTGRHSGSGLMRAHWDTPDLHQMSYKPMAFTPLDASLIRSGLSQRQTRLSAMATAP